MSSLNKPTSLEEALNLVYNHNKRSTETVSSDPFGAFMLNLAKKIEEEKKSFVPKEIEEEIIVEEAFEEDKEMLLARAIVNLEEALIHAKREMILQKELEIEENKRQAQLRVENEARLLEEEATRRLLEEEEAATKKRLEEEKEARIQKLIEEERIRRREVEAEKRAQFQKTMKEEQLPVLNEDLTEANASSKKPYVPNQDNPYVSELSRATKNNSKQKGKRSEIKKLIAEQVAAELEAYKKHLFAVEMSMGGGGGTNAVQYAAGGTMNGDLNVNGTILSGGLALTEVINQSVLTTIAGISSQFVIPDPLVTDDGAF